MHVGELPPTGITGGADEQVRPERRQRQRAAQAAPQREGAHSPDARPSQQRAQQLHDSFPIQVVRFHLP